MSVITALGNLIGGAAYLGACAECRVQFMSTHDRAALVPHGAYLPVIVCERCARKAGA